MSGNRARQPDVHLQRAVFEKRPLAMPRVGISGGRLFVYTNKPPAMPAVMTTRTLCNTHSFFTTQIEGFSVSLTAFIQFASNRAFTRFLRDSERYLIAHAYSAVLRMPVGARSAVTSAAMSIVCLSSSFIASVHLCSIS